MEDAIRAALRKQPIRSSAPCRVDMGGTVDIATLYYPLARLRPATFNIALNLRTQVQVSDYTPGVVRVSSKGFSPAEFAMGRAPFNHPLGNIFAVAEHFGIDGIHIDIDSSSPPKSALGGSSAAAVAVIAALYRLREESGAKLPDGTWHKIPELAHAVEEGIALVPCGCQDQMAAAFGGVNAWYWNGRGKDPWYIKKSLLEAGDASWINDRMLVAYCGAQHESKEINGLWIRGFLEGTHRRLWEEIVSCTADFIHAFSEKDLPGAIAAMSRDTAIRRQMTPGVLDKTGIELVKTAVDTGAGARFTGAGGGGCIWAFGEPDRISDLRPIWDAVLAGRKGGMLLDASVDMKGVTAK